MTYGISMDKPTKCQLDGFLHPVFSMVFFSIAHFNVLSSLIFDTVDFENPEVCYSM